MKLVAAVIKRLKLSQIGDGSYRLDRTNAVRIRAGGTDAAAI